MKKPIPPKTDAVDAVPTPVAVPISQCALARAIGEVGDGWTLLILREVLCGATRFGLMQEELGISRAVLAERLALLIERDVLVRHPFHEPGRRRQHVYLLSAKGRALVPALVALRIWSERFVPGDPSPLRLRTSTGEDVEVRLTTSDGRAVDVDEIVASTTEG